MTRLLTQETSTCADSSSSHFVNISTNESTPSTKGNALMRSLNSPRTFMRATLNSIKQGSLPVTRGAQIALVSLTAATAMTFVVAADNAKTVAQTVAQNQLQRTQIEAVPDSAQLTFTLTGKPQFSLVKLSSPHRVVLDLNNTSVTEFKSPALATEGFVKEIAASSFQKDSNSVGRIVVATSDDAVLHTQVQGNQLVLTLQKKSTSTIPEVNLVGDSTKLPQAHKLIAIHSKKYAPNEGKIELRTDGQIERYHIEEVENPNRLVVDLYGVKGSPKLSKDIRDLPIHKVRVGPHEDHVRVVLDVQDAFPSYDVAKTESGLVVLLKPSSSKEPLLATNSTTKAVLPQASDTKTDLKPKPVESSPKQVVRPLVIAPIHTVNTTPEKVATNTTHIKNVKESNGKNSAKIDIVEIRGDIPTSWADVQPEAAPYQAANMNGSIDVGSPNKRYTGRRISIDLMDADVVNVIRFLGDASGKNVIIDEDVKGKITLRLKSVPWDQALDVVLKTKALGMDTSGGIIRVMQQSKLDQELDKRLKQREALVNNAPTSVRLIPVNYATAGEMQTQIKELLSARGKITADTRTNVIIVEDIKENLDQAERMVRVLDTQTPQVLIEARMVEASSTFVRDLGVQWGGGLLFSQRGGNPTGLVFPANIGAVGAAGDSTAGVIGPSNYAVNLPAQSVNSSVGLNLGSIGNFAFLNARVMAAEQQGQAKTISAPRVTTLNNRRARISQGYSISIAVQTAQTSAVQTVQANLALDVMPHVTADGSVMLNINITNGYPKL